MAKPIANLRLFVAVYPPAAVVDRLVEAARALKLPRHRLTPAEQIHLTLLFIGDMPETEMEPTYESVARSAAGLGPFTLAVERLITLPERGPSRLIAAETSAPPQLVEMQRRLATRLASKPSNREYKPHMTILRFTSPSMSARIDQVIDAPPQFDVNRIQLMRSTLRPEGAVHHPLREFLLGE